MRISACYIVKDEADNLQKSLMSLYESVDEIIVIDTGSQDNSKEIAKQYGARVYEFPWQDDFSAPRNFALEKASGDWIVFIDADEYFTEDTASNLRLLIKRYHEIGKRGGLLIHRYDIDKDNNNEILADTLMLRIFFHNPCYRYEGIIHEELVEEGRPVEELYIIPPTDLKLMHTGYSNSLSLSKAERNLRLLLRELSTTNNPGRLYMYLADAYLGLGEKEKARYYAYLDVDQGRRNTTYASRSYRILLQLSLEDGDDLKKRLQLCQRAVHDYPESPEFRADLAECWAALTDYKRAVEEMTIALQNYQEYHGIEPMLFTAEQAELAQKRMEVWCSKMNPVDLAEMAELMRMFLLPLVRMKDEEYRQVKSEFEEILPPAFVRILKRYHGEQAGIDDSCSREYLDVLDILLAQNQPALLEKLLSFSNGFSVGVRDEIAAWLDKKIAQEEFSQEVNYV
ncbi:glycosyltransferase family 2 protein [Selenomonas ruminantium]|uniref:glycosyltransferase family 2 protein n=1 Tax=Selenomonas ruminantium TaxID=971 RepID=UPI0003FB35C8|nr:glycosyltransferase family 2 protein [Selenomonas ruminantium]